MAPKPTATTDQKGSPYRVLNLSLWVVQGLIALTLAGGAIWKVTTPIEELAKEMPWMGEVTPEFFFMTAFFDFLGGVGIILPSITRIRPKLTPLAALGSMALMLAAILFHLSRGEGSDTPFNAIMIALLAFVYWGRTRKFPIVPRP